ncbi:MAG: hypothetical protein LBF22_04880 [Deltaproteobacteria bacterium]|nr:hypothetical protein [Deltaproteobacteria bacterium]
MIQGVSAITDPTKIRNVYDFAFGSFLQGSIGLTLGETGLVPLDHEWAKYKIIIANGISLVDQMYRINTDLLWVLEENDSTPKGSKNAKKAKKYHYLAVEFETGSVTGKTYHKYARYIDGVWTHLVNLDKKKRLPYRVPSLKLLVVGGFRTYNFDINHWNMPLQADTMAFFVRDIDREKTFSEIQELITSKTPLSFYDRFRLMVLPISGKVKKIDVPFLIKCANLVVDAFFGQDAPLENQKNRMDFDTSICAII